MNIWFRLIFSVIYTLGYLLASIEMLGGGHGTLVFLPPLLTWWLLFIALALLSWLQYRAAKVSFVMVIVTHYLVSAFLIGVIESGDNWNHTLAVLNMAPVKFCSYAAWYLVGQVTIWASFFRQSKSVQSNQLP